MNIEELKLKIESKTFDSSPIIFVIKDKDFIPKQYISNISNLVGLEIRYIDNLYYSSNIFEMQTDSIQVYVCDVFNFNKKLFSKKYTYIICKKVINVTEDVNNIVEVPKLENWQIIDYVYSRCDGVDRKQLDSLITNCSSNIDRLENEISKIYIFDKERQQSIMNMLLEDNAFSDISSYKIFDFSNAIIKKDIKVIKEVFEKISFIDIEPIGLLTILVNQFRNIISIQLANNPTPESTGLKPNQFWAIKHSCGLYSKEQLVKIYMFLTDIDRQIKIGDMPMNYLIDYLVVKVMSF